MSSPSIVHHYHHYVIIQCSPPKYLPGVGKRRWRPGVTSLLRRAWNTLPSYRLLAQCKRRAYQALKKSYQQWLPQPSFSPGRTVSSLPAAAKSFTAKPRQMTTITPHNGSLEYPAMVLQQPTGDCLSADKAINREPASTPLTAEPANTPIIPDGPVKQVSVAPEPITQQNEPPSSPCPSLEEVSNREYLEPSLETKVSPLYAEGSDSPMMPAITAKQPSDTHKNGALGNGQYLEGHFIDSDASIVDEAGVDAVGNDLSTPASSDHPAIFSQKTAKGVGIVAAATAIPLAVATALGYGAFVLAAAHPVLLITLGCIAVGGVGYRAFNQLTRRA